MRDKRFLHFRSQWPWRLTFKVHICSTIVTLVQRYVSTKIQDSTAFLFWENRRHVTDRQTDGVQRLMRRPREGHTIAVRLRYADHGKWFGHVGRVDIQRDSYRLDLQWSHHNVDHTRHYSRRTTLTTARRSASKQVSKWSARCTKITITLSGSGSSPSKNELEKSDVNCRNLRP